MKITVIIPTFKPQEYLYECLDSIKNQTISRDLFEVLIVLNGCGEPYYSNIQEYIENKLLDCNVAVLQVGHAGVSNARNIGLDVARGEYITFLDDDDIISPMYLELLLSVANKDVVALSNVLSFRDNVRNAYPSSISKQFQKLCHNKMVLFYKARKFFSPICAKLIHRDIIGDRRFDITKTHGEDSLFLFLISDRMKYVQFTSSDAIYYRRIRENSATTSKRSLWAVVKNKHENAIETTRFFFSNIKGYSFNFYVTRILAGVKAVLVDMLNRIKK